MSRTQTLRVLKESLHISYSQISAYLTCSLRYYLQYVAGLKPERTGSALPLGSALHAVMARYFETLQSSGVREKREVLCELFRDSLAREIAQNAGKILYKSDAPDADALANQGEMLLDCFLENVNPGVEGMEVVGVELPLATRLYDPHGVATDFNLIGVIDLLLRDAAGKLIAVDHKTARNAYAQETVDQDLQLSAYALLLSGNEYLDAGEDLQGRYDILRKIKTPKMERLATVRTSRDQQRFQRIAGAVLQGVEAGVFIPCRGWQCADCGFAEACRAW